MFLHNRGQKTGMTSNISKLLYLDGDAGTCEFATCMPLQQDQKNEFSREWLISTCSWLEQLPPPQGFPEIFCHVHEQKSNHTIEALKIYPQVSQI